MTEGTKGLKSENVYIQCYLVYYFLPSVFSTFGHSTFCHFLPSVILPLEVCYLRSFSNFSHSMFGHGFVHTYVRSMCRKKDRQYLTFKAIRQFYFNGSVFVVQIIKLKRKGSVLPVKKIYKLETHLFFLDSRSRVVVTVRWSVSSQNRIFVLFYEDDMLPFLLRSLNIL